MTKRLLLALALALAVLAGVSLTGAQSTATAAPAVATSAAADSTAPRAKTVFFTLFYEEEVKPRRIYFYANSGPYLRHLKWKNWRTNRTVARGQYVGYKACAECEGGENRPARVIFSKKVYCESRDVYYYARGLMYRKPDRGQRNPQPISAGSCPDE